MSSNLEYSQVIDVNPGTTRHVLRSSKPIERKSDDNYMFAKRPLVVLTAPGVLLHPEHQTLEVPPGHWNLGVVQEYDPWLDQASPVFD